MESEYLMNTVALLYSVAAKLANRQATGYAILQTTAARDGGMREDTIKLMCNMVHPRTSQKYDKKTLAKDWNLDVQNCMENELAHFEAIKKVANRIKTLRDNFKKK